jgi:amidohydrolase
MLAAAAKQVLGADAVVSTPQSMGGEDFAWYLESIPGSLARLGTRRPGSDEDTDIHQAAFNIDERAIGIGMRVMAAAALTAISGRGVAPPPLHDSARA